MKVEIDFEKDMKRVKRELKGVQKRIVPAATSSALNRTAKQARTQSARDLKGSLGKSLGLSVSGFKRTIRHIPARVRRLFTVLEVSGRPLPLIRFGARKASKGVSAAPWGKRRIYNGTFIRKMPSGHRGVFKRTGKKRLPIKELWGPSIPKAFLHQDIQQGLKRVINDKWPGNFAHEIRHRLRKFNRG